MMPDDGSPLFVHGAGRGWDDLGRGISRQVLCHDEALMMIRVRFAAGAAGTVHHHPHRQAMVVESGRFRVEIGGQTRELGPGDAFLVPPDVEHGMTAIEAGVLVGVFVPARPDILSRDPR